MSRFGLSGGSIAGCSQWTPIMRPIEQVIADAEREVQEQAELARIRLYFLERSLPAWIVVAGPDGPELSHADDLGSR